MSLSNYGIVLSVERDSSVRFFATDILMDLFYVGPDYEVNTNFIFFVFVKIFQVRASAVLETAPMQHLNCRRQH